MSIKRQEIIFGYPGEIGDKHYCEGVLKDIENYKNFLLSPIGGAWNASEIFPRLNPAKITIMEQINNLREVYYSLIIFSGHGYYNIDEHETIIQLNRIQEMNESALMESVNKRLIILDCCRESYNNKGEKVILESMQKIASTTQAQNSRACRLFYDRIIEQCDEELIVIHSCSKDEKSGDDSEEGGYYSANLLFTISDWNENEAHLIEHYSIADAHIFAKELTRLDSGGLQNAQIRKNRTNGLYFPIAVKYLPS